MGDASDYEYIKGRMFVKMSGYVSDIAYSGIPDVVDYNRRVFQTLHIVGESVSDTAYCWRECFRHCIL